MSPTSPPQCYPPVRAAGPRVIYADREKVEAWEKRLGLLNETLDEWVAVQRNWMYLETIFCAEDIQKQLPEEAAKFQAVDKMWKASRSDFEGNTRKSIFHGVTLIHIHYPSSIMTRLSGPL